MSQTDPGEPMEFSTALYVSAMMLSTVGGPVPVSPGARVAAALAVLVFLPLAAIRVRASVKSACSPFHPFIRHLQFQLISNSGGPGIRLMHTTC